MDTTLLATKFFIPRVTPGLVQRSRLVQRLQGILNNRLTLVSAPAGFGKTTILSQWIHDNSVRISWLSLEDAENDPVRFWDYFIGGLRKISTSIGDRASPLLHSSQPIPIEATLNVLLNDITSIPEDFVLVLDDYYFIQSEAVHRGLTYFIEHMPPVMHLVIATRVDPPLPLPRFRGKGAMLLEIGTDDLRFSAHEASGLLTTLMGQALPMTDLEAINARAEGWAVGLKMAALYLGKQRDITESLAAFTGSQRYIMDYLVEEVLAYQSEDVRDFLLKTSVLARLCGPLCDAVTGNSDGRERLLNLEKANLFLTPLDESREWYRYHHLFAELLRHQVDLEYGKEMAYELHKKAGRWYEDNTLFEEAIGHALSAEDWVRAMEIIGRPDVLAPRIRTQTLLNWLQRIPEEVLRTNIERYANYAWALEGRGQYGVAEECLNYLDTVAIERGPVEADIANLRATIALDKGDIQRAEEYARKSLSRSGPNDIDQRAVATVVLGAALMMRARNIEAESVLRESADLFQRAGWSPANTVVPFIWLGLAMFGQGKLYEAAEAYEKAIALAGDDPVSGQAHQGLGSVYYRWNYLEASAEHFKTAIQLLQHTKNWSLEGAYLGLAVTRAASGDADGAMKALEEADRLRSERGLDPGSRPTNAASHAAVALLLRDREAASRWVSDLAESDAFQLLSTSVSAVRLFWSSKDRKMVTEGAETLRQQCVRGGSQAGVAGIRIIQALDSLGPDSPTACLAEALPICRTANAVRVFVDVGPEMRPLLIQAISRGIEPEFARKLLSIIEAEEKHRQAIKAKGMPIPQSSEFLSLRELEVLRLAAAGLSNREIAQKLTVSLNTAKTHMRNITEKLDASSRTQTIARARALKLI